MRSEREIREILAKCDAVSAFGLSDGQCPLEEDGRRGCCAECSFPSAMRWVLGSDGGATDNGQDKIIKALKGE